MTGASGFHYFFDRSTQHRLHGWTTAPSLDIAVNDGIVGRITPDIARPDLIEADIGPGAGFDFAFPRPLWLDDFVSVHGPDGSSLGTGLDAPTAARIRELTRYCDPASQVGLEIGPLDRPLIPKTRFRIYYLDQAPHDELVPRFASQGIDPVALIAPDFAAGAAPYAELVGDLRFDYAIASHVIEHVPDMVGWLWQVWSVLRDGGVLSLAIPHAERSFDARRRLTTLADLVEPYFGRFIQPSPRQIIDAQLGSALFHGGDLMAASVTAFHLANYARKNGLYVDLHCNVFTPGSFAHCLACLDGCELLGFDVLSIGTSEADEFTAHLRKRGGKVAPAHVRP